MQCSGMPIFDLSFINGLSIYFPSCKWFFAYNQFKTTRPTPKVIKKPDRDEDDAQFISHLIMS